MAIVRLLTFLTALCLAGAAQAQNNWSAPGSGCVPAGATTAAARHATTLTSVLHATGAVGQIILVCPVARFNSGTTFWKIKLTCRDSTGTDPSAVVQAQVYWMALDTAAPVLLAAVSSNSSAVTALNTISSATFSHLFNFEANVYWVRVVLNRTATAQSAIFHAAYLDGTAI